MNEIGKRYIGLDVRKHYLVELGVYQELEVVMPARRVELANLEVWMKKTLTPQAPGRLPDRANRDLEGLVPTAPRLP